MCKQSHNTSSKFKHNTVKVVGENFPSTQNRPSGIYVDGICIQFIYLMKTFVLTHTEV